jgi:uncharacterized protein (TIGR02646 family)
MIRVRFDPAALDGPDRAWWDAWVERAEAKTRDYLDKRAKGEKCDFDGSVWSDLKSWLLTRVFHGKCAYCETRISGGFFGDAEHFRPKGNVTVPGEQGKRGAQLADGNAHSGYYWLAYDWQNLLPACQWCNNLKSDQFPVEGSYEATPAPATRALNEVERPLLIYPYEDDPSQFIRFGKGGVVTPVNNHPKGLYTIRVLGLDRKELMDERWLAQGQALEALESELGRMLTRDELSTERIERYMGPGARFSRAVHDWFVERVRLVTKRALDLANDVARKANGGALRD